MLCRHVKLVEYVKLNISAIEELYCGDVVMLGSDVNYFLGKFAEGRKFIIGCKAIEYNEIEIDELKLSTKRIAN